MQSIEMLMTKGEENRRGGQINVARLFYKRAADMNWAPGAMALASTYDVAELERLGARGGIQPDAKLAKQWYEKARELGAAEAQQRLIRLGSR
jgi:TPR repeat protein